jgi:sulfatase modifying factor 1
MPSRLLIFCICCSIFYTCNSPNKEDTEASIDLVTQPPAGIQAPEGMVWVPGDSFEQGALTSDDMALPQEKPAHPVMVDGFFMDESEVTNRTYQKFVEATGYVTVAERKIDWEEMKKQLPPGTPKPPDSLMQPGSLVFKKAKSPVPNLYDFSQWWEWKIGADWRHPQGPESSIEGKEEYPVVHIAFEDALAYCEWAGRRLPTEAEWELAAKGGLMEARFAWGEDGSEIAKKANTWEGEFPHLNTKTDGYENKAPVKSYPPNGYGLYDMAGNVWEYIQDWFNTNYYRNALNTGTVKNPQGAPAAYNPNNPFVEEKVIKGGSFLCNASYCASFRTSARMGNSLDSSQEHLGFRTVASPDMLSAATPK